MITIENATIYTVKGTGDIAYEVEYSDGGKVRAVKSKVGGWVRLESKRGDEWAQCGKPYIVKANRKRSAERLIDNVIAFIG